MWDFILEHGERLAYGIIVGVAIGWTMCMKYMLSRAEASANETKLERDQWRDKYLSLLEGKN